MATALATALPNAHAQAGESTAQASADADKPRNLLDIVFVESDLRAPGLATSQALDPQLVYWKLPELARLVNERAPLVLAANGLEGRCTVLPLQATPADREQALATPNRPTLMLHIASVSVSSVIRSDLAPNRGEANLQYKILGTSNAAAPGAPSTSLGFRLGAHPAWGVLKIQKIDADWVDEMLMQALDQAARQGAVRLQAGKAVKPKS
jgi:hypothetical protein